MIRFFPHLFVSVSLACVLVCNGINVGSVQDLIDIFYNPTEKTVSTEITLTSDMNFSERTFTPLGSVLGKVCVPYSGTLHGNGHHIKNIVVSTFPEYMGLFCSLKNARIENLVFDSSCFFRGFNAGSLGASVTGSLKVVNVTINANVTGSGYIGGFIGTVADIDNESSLEFENCLSAGKVQSSEWYAGGFIGSIRNNKNISIIFSNSMSTAYVHGNKSTGGFVAATENNTNVSFAVSSSTTNGIVIGVDVHVGGFIGNIYRNKDINMAFYDCMGNGSATGIQNVGGFMGHIYGNTNIDLFISRCTNNGTTNSSGFYAGGFTGLIGYNQNSNMTILHSTNNGFVTGCFDVGGFIGVLIHKELTHCPFPTVQAMGTPLQRTISLEVFWETLLTVCSQR